MRSLGWVLPVVLVLPGALAANDWSQFRYNETHQGGVPASLNTEFAPFKTSWWSGRSAASPVGSPVVRGDLVYFGDASGTLHAWNRQTGDEVWSNTTGAGSRISSAPAVGANSVYVINEAGLVYAFDRNTGALETGFPLTIAATTGSILLHGDILYVGGTNGIVYSYFASTQEFRWSFDSKGTFFGRTCTGGRIDGTPVVFETWLLFGSTNHCFFAVATSQPIGTVKNPAWVYVASEAIRSSAAVDVVNRRVLFGDVDGKLYAVPVASSGNATSPAWTYQEPLSQGVSSEIKASPAISGDKVIVAPHNGNVRALLLSTGAVQWTRNVLGNVTSSPAVANGYVLVGSFDARMYMLWASNGTVAGKWTASAAIETSPAISGTQGFWAAKDGTLYSWGGTKPAQPDLAIGAPLAVGAIKGQPGPVLATVRNQGAAAAPPSTAALFSGETKVAEVAVPALEPGQEHALEASWTPPANGSMPLRWVSDASDSVAESDETNNEGAFEAQVLDASEVNAAATGAGKKSFWRGPILWIAIVVAGLALAFGGLVVYARLRAGSPKR